MGRNAQSLLVHRLGLIVIFSRFVQFAGRNVKPRLSWIVFDVLLVESESLVRSALLHLHFAEFFDGVGVVLVEFDGFAQGGIGAGQIFLAVEERSSKQVVKVGDVRGLGDLSIRGGDRLVILLLGKIIVHQTAQAFGGRRIFIYSLLIVLLGIRVMRFR